MASLLLLTSAPGPSAEVLPALALLPHTVRVASPDPASLLAVDDAGIPYDAVLAARTLCGLLHTTGLAVPLLVVVTEGGLVAVSAAWQVDDVVLDTAGPAEVDARLRLAVGRRATDDAPVAEPMLVRAGELEIDEHAYTARLRGEALDLTFKEFELLRFLAQHPGRVFSRAQLLQEVWGYDYYGGTRTVDVHVRRLRAKLGTEHETMIGTVRNVGYKFVGEPAARADHPTARADRQPH
jgi:DNA-binding response OmpR family regulator